MEEGSRRFWELPVYKPMLKGHVLEVEGDRLVSQAGQPNAEVAALVQKLNAEYERIARLLPTPPEGMRWEMEHQRSEDLQRNTVYFRVVATLKEIKPWEIIE